MKKILEPGDLVGGKWRIKKPIREGQFKGTYKVSNAIVDRINGGGDDVLPDEIGALKVQRVSSRFDQEIVARTIFADITALSLLRKAGECDNIPQILDSRFLDDEEREIYFVEKFVEGDTWDRTGPLTLRENIKIAGGVANSLRHTHEMGLVHGDVKPGNVMIDSETGRPVLVDFGSARQGRGAPLVKSSVRFRAPEVCDGELLAASDLYSLAASVYTMLSGQLPFRSSIEDWTNLSLEKRSEQEGELEDKHRNSVPIRLSGLIDIPSSLEEVIMAGLQKNPDRRPTAQEFYEAMGGGMLEPLWWVTKVDPPSDRVQRDSAIIQIIDQGKVLPVARMLGRGQFPYAIPLNEKTWTIEAEGGEGWASGRWPGRLLNYGHIALAEEWMNNLREKFVAGGDDPPFPVRADNARSAFAPHIALTRDSAYVEDFDTFVEELRKFYDHETGIIRLARDSNDPDFGLIWPATLIMTTPILFEIGGVEDRIMASKHTVNTMRLLQRTDGSVKKFLNLSEGGSNVREVHSENVAEKGDDSSRQAKELAYAMYGCAIAYHWTGNEEVGGFIDRGINFLDSKVREGQVPYSDLGLGESSPPDTNAGIHLVRAYQILGRRKRAENLLDSILNDFLILDASHEGTLSGVFRNSSHDKFKGGCGSWVEHELDIALREDRRMSLQ